MADRWRWREQLAGLKRARKTFERQQTEERDRYLGELRAQWSAGGPDGGPDERRLRGLALQAGLLWRRVLIDDLGTHSGALTYGAVLSIPPLLVFAMSVLGVLLAGSVSAQKSVIDALASIVPEEIQSSATKVLEGQMSAAISGKLSFGIVGLVGLLWSASGLAARLRHALGLIFGTARTGLWSGRIVGALVGLFVVVSLAGVAVLSAVQTWASGPWSEGFIAGLAFQLAILAGQFVFILLTYQVLTPGEGVGLRDHLLGTAVFIVGFEGLLLVGDLYFGHVVSKSSALYGALGSLFGAIAFLYSTAWLLLLGAEVSAFRWEERRGRLGGVARTT